RGDYDGNDPITPERSLNLRGVNATLPHLHGRPPENPLAGPVADEPTRPALLRSPGRGPGRPDRRRRTQAGPPLQRRRAPGRRAEPRRHRSPATTDGCPAGAVEDRTAGPCPRRRPVERTQAGPAHRPTDRPADAPGHRLGVAAQARL